jgi:FkbH-like protein
MTVLNIYQLTQKHGFLNFINLKNGFLFQAPWTKIALSAIASEVLEKITLFNQIRKKILFLDADNTLWGGIVGEDGLDNIDIDENYPGVTYRLFQNQIKQLKNSGILLAMVSKNNKEDIEEVFNKKNMPLKLTDFIATKINWNPKSQNIIEILEDLKLGKESAVFIDDSDFELSEVKNSLNIDVVKASSINPIDNLYILEKISSIKTLNISLEDKNKSTQYLQESSRKNNESKFESIEEYLCDICMEITMSLNNFSQIKRITQLINKTNQFNSTSKRYNEADVMKIMSNHKVYSFSLVDKFGDLGIISIAILIDNNIDLFLMSCRALGRKVENKVLFIISNDHESSLSVRYKSNNKNAQVESFFEDLCIKKKEERGGSILYFLPKLIDDVDYIKLVK